MLGLGSELTSFILGATFVLISGSTSGIILGSVFDLTLEMIPGSTFGSTLGVTSVSGFGVASSTLGFTLVVEFNELLAALVLAALDFPSGLTSGFTSGVESNELKSAVLIVIVSGFASDT